MSIRRRVTNAVVSCRKRSISRDRFSLVHGARHEHPLSGEHPGGRIRVRNGERVLLTMVAALTRRRGARRIAQAIIAESQKPGEQTAQIKPRLADKEKRNQKELTHARCRRTKGGP